MASVGNDGFVLRCLAVSNYRSLRDLVVPLGRLTVVTGSNGAGKSNLYRALRLLADTAQGGAVGALAGQGGMPATLWAGPRGGARAVERGQVDHRTASQGRASALRLGYAGDEFGYAVELGYPVVGNTAFGLDPVIKTETVWAGSTMRPSSILVSRANGVVWPRADDRHDSYAIGEYDSMLTEFADPAAAPELLLLRDRMRGWRFYDHIRTDSSAPARQTRIGTRTPVMSGDGADLAAAIQTIREVGDRARFDDAIEDAFPGSTVEIDDDRGRFELHWH